MQPNSRAFAVPFREYRELVGRHVTHRYFCRLGRAALRSRYRPRGERAGNGTLRGELHRDVRVQQRQCTDFFAIRTAFGQLRKRPDICLVILGYRRAAEQVRAKIIERLAGMPEAERTATGQRELECKRREFGRDILIDRLLHWLEDAAVSAAERPQ